MAASGASAEEIVRAMNDLAPRVDASFLIDRLDYLYKGGRCSAVAALGGVVQETQYAAAVTVCALLPEEAGEAFAAQVRDLTAGRCAVRPVGETERAVPLAGAGL